MTLPPALLDPGHVVPRQAGVELLVGPLGQRAHVLDAFHVAVDVAELAPLGVQHAPAPVRLGHQVEQVAHGGLGRRRQAVLDVLVPLAHDLQVERDDQCRTVGGARAVDQPADEVAVAHDVELEPERVAAGGFGNVLDGADAHGRERERNAELFGSARREDFAVGMLHAGEPRGRNRHRHGHVLADHLRAGVAVLDVHRHALAQQDLLEVGLVGAVGAFGVGARVGVVVEHARHAAPGQNAQVFDAGDGGHGCGSPREAAMLAAGAGGRAEEISPPEDRRRNLLNAATRSGGRQNRPVHSAVIFCSRTTLAHMADSRTRSCASSAAGR